jgi:hypothetical protein
VDELDKLPRLRELRLSGNPLVEEAKSGGRFEVRPVGAGHRGVWGRGAVRRRATFLGRAWGEFGGRRVCRQEGGRVARATGGVILRFYERNPAARPAPHLPAAGPPLRQLLWHA